MKLSFLFLAVLTSLNLIAAYPSALLRGLDLSNATTEQWDLIKREIEAEMLKSRSLGFDAGAQYINTKGSNKFIPPNLAAGDQRGPCPALNALANHNYLPHNGVGTITDFLQSTYKVFGLGLDISTILGVFGAVTAGNGVVWSIGGKTNAVPGIPLLLKQPGGISNTHNQYEGDASPTRGDMYQFGNAYKLVMSQFEEMFNKQPDAATADYGHTGDVDVLQAFRVDRIAQSKSQNPNFFAAPVPFLVAGAGAYQFISLFANHSAERPEGRLDQETLKSFFAITGSGPGHFTYKEGWERIPDNWYRRPIGYEYDQPKFFLDVIAGNLKHPEFIALGGNTGAVNSFAGINLIDLTGGLYNLQDLSNPQKAWCFVHEAMLAVIPGILESVFRTLLGTFFGAFGCPVHAQYWDAEVFNIFPGYKMSL